MLLHISLHGCFRLICSVFLDLLTQIEGSTFGGWLCDLMHISSYSHFLCVFVCVCACVISQGDSLVGLDHEQWVYRLEQPTRKLHSKSAFHQWLILKLPVCPTCVCVCVCETPSTRTILSPHILFWLDDRLMENILTWTWNNYISDLISALISPCREITVWRQSLMLINTCRVFSIAELRTILHLFIMFLKSSLLSLYHFVIYHFIKIL